MISLTNAEIVALGDSALIIRVGNSLEAVLAATARLAAAKIEDVVDVAPAFASVGVFFATPQDLESRAAAVRALLRGKGRAPRMAAPRRVEVPVCYEGDDLAPDLEQVARHCRLSPGEMVQRHAAAEYRVRCIGFTPGFPFLGGLPSELATPRRSTPRTAVPAGSVAIGGAQTGVYSLRSPGGWNIIGRTPLRLFDVKREVPALLRAGDRVRFRVITRAAFAQWER